MTSQACRWRETGSSEVTTLSYRGALKTPVFTCELCDLCM